VEEYFCYSLTRAYTVGELRPLSPVVNQSNPRLLLSILAHLKMRNYST